jgi:hypothetical protein
MAILDYGAAEPGGWWDAVPETERPDLPRSVLRRTAVPRRAAPVMAWDTDGGVDSAPDLMRWTLRIATVIALLIATLLGLEIAMDAPTISPVSVAGRGPHADGQS